VDIRNQHADDGVDDTKLWFSAPQVRLDFLSAWAAAFGEPPARADLSEDFVGIRSVRIRPSTIELTCVGVIKSIQQLIAAHPAPGGRVHATPMPADAPRRLLTETDPEDGSPGPEIISLARSVGGAVGFVTTHVRAEGYFPYCALSRYMGPRLTWYAFKLLIRLGHYLVSTMDMPLVIYSSPRPRISGAWGSEGVFEVFCDSSHGNAPDGSSHGGFVLMNRGGGALAWKCRAQALATDSPGAQGLLMTTLAYRWTLSLRMLLADLEIGAELVDPTIIWTDSQILLDGTRCERLGKSSRWLAARYAMIRFGIQCGAITARKQEGAENVSDIVTKLLTGALFAKHRATILGLAHAISPAWAGQWGLTADESG